MKDANAGLEDAPEDGLDAYLDGLQEHMDAEALTRYGPEGYRRWRGQVNMGRMENPSCHGRVAGSCGDAMEMFFRIEDERIVDACYATDGCGASMVCGSVAVDLCRGAALEDAMDISAARILGILGGLPEDDRHCATLASEAAKAAAHAWMTGKRKP
jgi:nitrogen fixation protein NifU and related proteins